MGRWVLRRAGTGHLQLLRHRRNEPQAFLYAFDLLELDGTDLRREPIEIRKATLASVLAKAGAGIRFCEHLDFDDGQPCSNMRARWGWRESPYRSGRSKDWLKMKNPACEAVRRKAEEDWRPNGDEGSHECRPGPSQAGRRAAI
jgi:ATP-dependent DNA ligase